MEGFDTPGIFFSDTFGDDDNLLSSLLNSRSIKKSFKDFLKTYNEENFNYKYRDTLKRNCNLGQYWMEINVEDLAGFDENLADKLYKQPVEHLPAFEEAATELAQELLASDNLEDIEHIQILLSTNSLASSLRSIKSESVSRLVKIPGIIVSASSIRAKATQITLQCRSCRNVVPHLPVKPGMDGYILPRKCTTEQAGRPQCPLDPYFIIPDKCKCVDSQILKLQELSDSTPQGEMPRHVQLYCDRYLCERVVPGNRVMVVGVYSIKKVKTSKKQKLTENSRTVVGVRAPYLRVLGFQIDDQVGGFTTSIPTSVEDEELFRKLSSSPDIYDRIAKSIAPSIFGFSDIKKAIACLLFGGSRKRLPDGLTRRGDINLLLLGDPGTAKSQLLKFVQQVSPIGVYTSGKGSSAAGLTASVTRDPTSHNFVVEGGAMVLADSGVVCIDEFDKMREGDRVAIHEAMEQQTISIAKAGITTTLNSRCSVMAAANSVFGRWDDSKGEDNIDFMPTILSSSQILNPPPKKMVDGVPERFKALVVMHTIAGSNLGHGQHLSSSKSGFDMIFIIKDEHNQNRDMILAKHIMNVHLMNGQAKQEVEGELPLATIKKFLNYCRQRCGPRLSEEAGEKLKSRYVIMRTGCHELESEKKLAIPITVRQLEAIIRIAESLAKMQLQPFATDSHVDEALRLFQVSTLSAATSGCLSGVEGFSTEEDTETLQRIEKQLKRRFPIGSQVSEFSIIQDFLRQKYPQRAIDKVIYLMIRRGEIQHIMQRKMLIRLK
ncbi:DNA replication licensing factor Mcm5-like [Aphis craccivora]|uniref:DNA replication licensing factor MCM5 n=1 Tax=Aphis craccivora TaxID=307492 RepID=A0A6G0YV02_APHCR|nr:DNA replication licensing factor Mcm5-like [Aphis craccivora]